MGRNDAKPSYVREELIDFYFEVKIREAEHAEDDARLKFLLVSRRIWKEQKALHIRTALDIARWAKEGEELNQMLAGTTSRRTPRSPRRRIFSALMVIPLTGNVLACALDGWQGNWIGIPVTLAVWCYGLHSLASPERRKDS